MDAHEWGVTLLLTGHLWLDRHWSHDAVVRQASIPHKLQSIRPQVLPPECSASVTESRCGSTSCLPCSQPLLRSHKATVPSLEAVSNSGVSLAAWMLPSCSASLTLASWATDASAGISCTSAIQLLCSLADSKGADAPFPPAWASTGV